MTEEQLNKKYLKEILPNCEDEKIDIINKLMSEQYIKGVQQGKFDVQMDLCSYLEEKKGKHQTLMNNSENQEIQILELVRLQVYQDILERIKSGKYE